MNCWNTLRASIPKQRDETSSNDDGYKKLEDWAISNQAPNRRRLNDYLTKESTIQVNWKCRASLKKKKNKDEDIV